MKNILKSSKIIDLSVVAASRNDNHGEKLLFRMNHFVNGFVQQCIRHKLNAELILVEWNPPLGQPSLSQVLKFPEERGGCQIRIITVPPEVHQRFENADKLSFYQMIAKNVGIRHARGKYVLATNIDIIFSDTLMRFIKDKLKPDCLYRVDRADILPEIPNTAFFDEILKFCKMNRLRINRKNGTWVLCNGKWKKQTTTSKRIIVVMVKELKNFINMGANFFRFILHLSVFKIFHMALKSFSYIMKLSFLKNLHDYKKIFLEKLLKTYAYFNVKRLHTNACGDFTLLHRKNWHDLRGYPEWPIFSWHLDSIFLVQAYYSGVREVDLGRKYVIYHIEHGKGSGYSPEGADLLFNRLNQKNIPYLTNESFIEKVGEIKKLARAKNDLVLFNDLNWGLRDEKLFEEVI